MQRKRNHLTDANFFGCLRDPLSVDADMSLFDQTLRQCSAFQQSDEEEIAV